MQKIKLWICLIGAAVLAGTATRQLLAGNQHDGAMSIIGVLGWFILATIFYPKSNSLREAKPLSAQAMEDLQAKAKTGDLQSAAQFKAAKWNETTSIGKKVLYLKSDIEGKVIAHTSRAAWASGEYAFIELEHIGMVLLDKVEIFFG